MKPYITFAGLLLTLTLPGISQASLSMTGTGSYNHSLSLLIDGNIPNEGSSWTGSENVYWYGTDPIFTLDLGSLSEINDILVSVDNNDDYSVEWSTDNQSWNQLFTISHSVGEIGWGMDTMSTDSTNPEYISALDFTPVTAQYIRIFATGGDNKYAVGELQVSSSPVPVPSAALLFASSLLGFLGFKRKIV